MSADHTSHRPLLSAFDKLGLTDTGGTYLTMPDVVDAEAARGLAQTFFDAFGDVGTSRFSIRVIHEGKDLHPSEFLSARIGDGLIDHLAVKDRVLYRYLRNGATIVFDHVNEHVPFAQIIQERVEMLTGARCWVQCYVTQASSSAFNLHRDDHAFVIVQLFGHKNWNHSPETAHAPSQITYGPGDVTFYPKQTPHDVSGIGELSMHLTIAFEGFDQGQAEDGSTGSGAESDVRRRGSGLPYSVAPDLITADTPARLALRHLPSIATDEPVRVNTGTSVLSVPARYAAALERLGLEPATTPREVSELFSLPLDDVLKFWAFGFEQGLLFTPVA